MECSQNGSERWAYEALILEMRRGQGCSSCLRPVLKWCKCLEASSWSSICLVLLPKCQCMPILCDGRPQEDSGYQNSWREDMPWVTKHFLPMEKAWLPMPTINSVQVTLCLRETPPSRMHNANLWVKPSAESSWINHSGLPSPQTLDLPQCHLLG